MQPEGITLLYYKLSLFDLADRSLFKISKVYDIGLQR